MTAVKLPLTRRESLALFAGLSVSACGGGSGGSAPAPSPSTTPAPPPPPPPANLYHVPLLGQSNAAGAEARPVLSTGASGWGNLMFARGVPTWSRSRDPQAAAARAANDFDLVGLAAGINETRATGLADHLKSRLLGSTVPVADRHRVLVSAVAEGSRFLTELGPEDHAASGQPGTEPPGGFWATLLDDIERGKSAAAARNYAYELPFWNYDQGEMEVGGMSVYRNRAADKPAELVAQYAERAIAMVQEFDRETRARLGKAAATPCLVTPACYNTLTPTAWLDASDRTPLAVVVGPRYQMPSALSTSVNPASAIHYSADGQRWIGEMVAKVGARLLAGASWRPLRALRAARVSNTEIDVVCHVPHGPIVLDTMSWPAIEGWGFALHAGEVGTAGHAVPATAIQVVDAATLRLQFPAVPAGAKLRIGGSGRFRELAGLWIAAVDSATLDGDPAIAIAFEGDHSDLLQRALANGPVLANGDSGASLVVRHFERSGTRTVILGKAAEMQLKWNRPFGPGERLFIDRAQPATNVRDSDDTPSLYRFAQGPRAGQPYPLHNWLATYDGLPIEGS
jgi:hypothetical protein